MWLSVRRVWAAARGHPRAERGGLPDAQRRQDRGGRHGARVSGGREVACANAHRAFCVGGNPLAILEPKSPNTSLIVLHVLR